MPRAYGEPLCSDPPNNDYPRPISPLHPYPNRAGNGFPYRGGALLPNGNPGTPLFSSQHHNELPFNHNSQQHIFNSNVNNGSHENKLPNSPSNNPSVIPLDGGNVNRSTTGQQHSYSNLQVLIFKIHHIIFMKLMHYIIPCANHYITNLIYSGPVFSKWTNK